MQKRSIFYLSNAKKIIILILICFLIFAGLNPTINKAIVKDIKDNDNNKKINEINKYTSGFKKINYNDYTHAHASFYWTPKYPDPGELVTFYSTSHATNGHISIERWKFHNGDSDHGFRAFYTYDKKGSYKVTLSVHAWGYNITSDWDSISRTIRIGADPFPEIKITPEDPSPGDMVTLDGSKSSDPDGSIVSYNWSFYNVENLNNVTNLGSEETISYSWDKQGVYVVCLYIKDDKGNNNTFKINVYVSVLKLDGFEKKSRYLDFNIINNGDEKLENIEWTVEIHKYSILGFKTKKIYQESSDIAFIHSGSYQIVQINDIKRKFCKIELKVTCKADNAVEVSKSYYGLIFGKRIYLSEENFINPYSGVFIAGIIATFLLFFFAPIIPK